MKEPFRAYVHSSDPHNWPVGWIPLNFAAVPSGAAVVVPLGDSARSLLSRDIDAQPWLIHDSRVKIKGRTPKRADKTGTVDPEVSRSLRELFPQRALAA